MIRSFIDSGVLIAAARGQMELSTAALRLLSEKNRAFASSIFIQLETRPKAIYHKQQLETDFYQTFFDRVAYWSSNLEQITQMATHLACTYGLGGMDALHIAAALLINADEFITTEKITKPMHRVTEIQMVSIASH